MTARTTSRRGQQMPEPKKVRCADCQHFQRDTEGVSRNIYTGEYFMGTCTAGLHPDTPIKQFADHLRECKKHAKN